MEAVTPMFSLGTLVATPAATEAMIEANVTMPDFMARYAVGDWGDVDPDDKRANDEALMNGEGRIMAAYELTTGVTVWAITEADRSATTILLPEEN